MRIGFDVRQKGRSGPACRDVCEMRWMSRQKRQRSPDANAPKNALLMPLLARTACCCWRCPEPVSSCCVWARTTTATPFRSRERLSGAFPNRALYFLENLGRSSSFGYIQYGIMERVHHLSRLCCFFFCFLLRRPDSPERRRERTDRHVHCSSGGTRSVLFALQASAMAMMPNARELGVTESRLPTVSNL